MTKFIKNSILILLTFSLTANAANKKKRNVVAKPVPTKQAPKVEASSTTYVSTANIPQNVSSSQNETVAFIDELNRNLPQIIQDINSSKSDLSKVLISQIREAYKGTVGFMDLIKAMFPFKKNNVDDRLLPLAGYLTIEALLLKAISNLQSQKNSGLDEDAIRVKAATLRATLNNSLNQHMNLSSDLNEVDPTNTKVVPAVRDILEQLNYKKIPEILGVRDEKLKAQFFDDVQKNASCLLTPSDQAILTGFVSGPIFQKMKAATNATTLTNFSDKILSNLPPSAKNLIDKAKTKVLTA